MKKLFLIFFIATQLNGFAQDKKLVKSYLKDATFFFNNEDYLNALSYYTKIIAQDKKHELANLNSVICKFRLSYPLDSILPHEENLISSKLIDAKFYVAKIRHQQKQFDLSIAMLEAYRKVPEKKRSISEAELDYLLNVNKSAIQMVNNPHRSLIKNMGKTINSVYAEYVPIITPEENTLYFTSRREGSSNNKKDAFGNYHEDVYVSHKEGDDWLESKNVGSPINTETNDACVAISPDGQRMIIYRAAPDGITGDLFITKLSDHNTWESLQKLGPEINSQFTETSACFSNDTSEIYFSSNRPGGYGGKDIYRIKKLPNGRWALPYNLGPNINTLYDEDAPYLHPDAVTLYFSSKGHNTMGEYDVFRSILNQDNNQFSKAENLGYPINNVGNDIFFVLNVDGQKGYYSSIKEDSHGSTDIYQIDTRFGDNDLKVKNGLLFKDDILGKAKITLLDNETNKVAGIYNSNPKTGKFILVMNPLKSYKAIVQEDGYQALVVELEPLALEKGDNDIHLKLIKK